MLLRLQRLERELLSGFERRQFVLQFFVFFVLAFFGFFVNFQEAVELHALIQSRGTRKYLSPDFASMSTVVWSKTAGVICEATKRCQISL